jgi:uncharacterized phage-associated protein
VNRDRLLSFDSLGGHDVRAVANFVLAQAFRDGREVSNLSLNKIIYFLHAAFLHQFQKPLVTAKIEAWNHGPVFREIYHQFKRFGPGNITELARRLNPISGQYEQADGNFSTQEQEFLRTQCAELLKVSAGRLVDMSHVPDGPWHKARFGNGIVNPGVEITNDLIAEMAAEQSRH